MTLHSEPALTAPLSHFRWTVLPLSILSAGLAHATVPASAIVVALCIETFAASTLVRTVVLDLPAKELAFHQTRSRPRSRPITLSLPRSLIGPYKYYVLATQVDLFTCTYLTVRYCTLRLTFCQPTKTVSRTERAVQSTSPITPPHLTFVSCHTSTALSTGPRLGCEPTSAYLQLQRQEQAGCLVYEPICCFRSIPCHCSCQYLHVHLPRRHPVELSSFCLLLILVEL